MPKPKKAKVPVSQTVAEVLAEEPPAPEPPAPCSPLPNKLTVVKPESPSQSLLLRAQRKARHVLSRMESAAPKRLQNADDRLQVALRTYSAKLNALEKAEKRKQKPSEVGQVQKAYKAELAYEMAKHEHTQSRWEVTVDLLTAYKALLAEGSAKVARLRRQLRMARRAKWLRRGWSTTPRQGFTINYLSFNAGK